MERQFKIGASRFTIYFASASWTSTVKPDATPEEVRAVVNDENNGQIFSQAVSGSVCSNDLHMLTGGTVDELQPIWRVTSCVPGSAGAPRRHQADREDSRGAGSAVQ